MPKKQNKKVTSFTIQREHWLSGKKGKFGERSKLLNRFGDMCCLGFYLRACGVPASRLRDQPTPSDVSALPKQALWLVEDKHFLEIARTDSSLGSKLVTANDSEFHESSNQLMTPEQREKEVKRLFAKRKIKVRFVE